MKLSEKFYNLFRKKQKLSSSFIVINCELIATDKCKVQESYQIQDLNWECEIISKSTTHHRILILGYFEKIINLENDLFGRGIVNSNGDVVAVIYRYINTSQISE